MIASETSEALRAFRSPTFWRKPMITGIEPMTSITANKTMVTVAVAFKLKSIKGVRITNEVRIYESVNA
jgi:hypothetical protein